MKDVTQTLNDLIATCRDSEEGFGKAAKGVHSDDLRARLIAIARERAGFADELAIHVTNLGGHPAESGHFSGIQHSGWRELEQSIRPKDDPEFLAECQRGEQNTLRHYQHAMSEDLPVLTREVVANHMLAIQDTLAELQQLEVARGAR